MNCAACPNKISKEEVLVCSGCKYSYHYACLNIPEEYYREKLQASNTWRCISCNNVTTRGQRGDSTPVRRHYEREPSPQEQTDMSMCDESQRDGGLLEHNFTFNNNKVMSEISMEGLSRLLDSKLAGVKSDFVMINNKLSTTKQEISTEIRKEFSRAIESIKTEFTETTDLISAQIASFKTDLSNVAKKVKYLEQENLRLNAELVSVKNNPNLSANYTQLQKAIEDMHAELNERDQALLLNDIEVVGVPEYPGESTIHIAQALAQKVGMSLDTQDVVSAERVGPWRATGATGGSDNTTQRPRPLVVRLARRPLRDQLLRSARVRRGVDTGNIGLPEHRPNAVYINERLTKTNRKLLWQAKQAGTAVGWRFVWTKEGRIFARKNDSKDSRAVRIQNEKDIKSVFCVDLTESCSIK